jgi:glycosyltransferase involved in cell wall biosynthesis
LLQGYPDLEYFVLDGGSTDHSREVIEKYSRWLTFWTSESDRGQSDAINRGLRRGSGLFATWINSDDMLCRNALNEQAVRFGFRAGDVYVGDCIYIDAEGHRIGCHRGQVFSLEDLLRIKTVWRAQDYRGHIDQPAVLFPRALALSVGGLNPSNHLTMDYEFWGELFLSGARFRYTGIPFGMFREHEAQKGTRTLLQTRSLIDAARNLAGRAHCLSFQTRQEIISDLEDYFAWYQKAVWEGTGRLARLALPRWFVGALRAARSIVSGAARNARQTGANRHGTRDGSETRFRRSPG